MGTGLATPLLGDERSVVQGLANRLRQECQVALDVIAVCQTQSANHEELALRARIRGNEEQANRHDAATRRWQHRAEVVQASSPLLRVAAEFVSALRESEG